MSATDLRPAGYPDRALFVSGAVMISISHNIRDFERGLSRMAREQVPFATAMALNDTAEDVQDAWLKHLDRRLDRPTPFTRRGIYRRRASKRRLTAEIGFKPVQAGYLRLQAEGGSRLPEKRAILIPVQQRLNRYGNMPKGAVKRVLARDDTFSGKVRGVAGIWKRPAKSRRKGAMKLLVAFQPKVRYQPRLDLRRAAEGRARTVFPSHFARRFRSALATRR